MIRKHRVSTLWVMAAAGLLALLTAACSHAPDPAPTYGFGEKAITVNITAGKDLNGYDNHSHTVLLVIYQMTDINAYNKLVQNEDGLRTLLEVTSPDPTLVASQKVFIEPGKSQTLVLDRAENASWIGMVAGFYRLIPGKVSKSFEIPYKVETRGIIFRKQVAEIQPLTVDLILGPDNIQEKN